MSNDIRVQTFDNITCVSGSLPDGIEDMIPVSKHESFNIDKIRRMFHPIMPNKINWDQVTSSAWFICIRPDNGLNYSFPLMESENRENNFARARKVFSTFIIKSIKYIILVISLVVWISIVYMAHMMNAL